MISSKVNNNLNKIAVHRCLCSKFHLKINCKDGSGMKTAIDSVDLSSVVVEGRSVIGYSLR
jgi:hypothetical protein